MSCLLRPEAACVRKNLKTIMSSGDLIHFLNRQPHSFWEFNICKWLHVIDHGHDHINDLLHESSKEMLSCA
ncbi:hypothetical protein KIN20_009789 [Parelaphostrongylus tenuis]|uniref:Uncharacterized protein n=1 Tax=Parelaphostrongylus tenuis TaxID=148309 RepID=A0AAD5QJW3_PARTN|nr:hypothetical protein KIN20_009789 [Parelaphostrongylus tenuis]